MAESRDLLVEIGTEELPPKALESLSTAFADALTTQLREADLLFTEVERYATPRRLAVWIKALAVAQPDRDVERKGPALKAAYDAEGNPTKAAQGFARSCGMEVDDLEVQETPKGAWLVYRQVQKGKQTIALVPAMVEEALARLPIPKRMRWGAGEAEFVRPVHWILMLFGEQVVDGEVLGIKADRFTLGHRFHHPEPIEIRRPEEYASRLRAPGKIVAGFADRRDTIRRQVEEKAREAGGTARIEAPLLDEVTALTEWPVAVMGRFDERFLEIPPEVLITTMQSHQKYFPVQDAEGALKPLFITIANIESRDPDQVRGGNERVIRPRFSDAAFFWEQDLKRPLAVFVEGLKGVVFQNRLGTLYEKAQRVTALARLISDRLGRDEAPAVRAAELCKCDLMSEMVGEFPSLQGTMGRYYAEHAGEPVEVAAAIEEHYMPRHARDRLPQTGAGQAVAIADKLDTLLGIFAIGHRPTGVKDPFGLRRAALGVLRILIESPLDLDLLELLEHAAGHIAPKVEVNDTAADEVFD
ncbi:MAG TPA: glycine--tRNA ligase subunit beta, partial [Chromatiales bacterium]|nr:glycine--tRNA ligase subunit beta [Chromatiales bacterium]